MSFEFTVLPDERFIEILEAWVDSPWPKTAEDGYALRDRFGWMPDSKDPALFTSDVEPDEPSAYFTESNDSINSLTFPITDIAPEEARGESLESAKVIYRHFCEILTRRYDKPKKRRNKDEYYRSTYITSLGVGISIGGNRSLIECYIKSPNLMFTESEYVRLVAKGYISEDE